MVYEKEYKDGFIVPVFTRESGYWEQVMKPRLQEQGWYIAEVDCAGAEDIEDCGTRLLRELNFIRILKISSLPTLICIRGMGLSSCFS